MHSDRGATAGPPKDLESVTCAVEEDQNEVEDDFLKLPEPVHVRVQDGFTPLAQQLRQHFDSR